MKTGIFSLSTLVAFVAAQDVSTLPECGRNCANNMLTATDLGCDANDFACLCQNPDFTYGLRDCSTEACGGDESRQVLEFGIALCSNNGVEITTGPSGEPTITATTGVSDASATTILSTFTTDGTAIVSGVSTSTFSGSNSATGSETDGAIVSTYTTDGTAVVTTLSTVASASDALSSASDALSSASDALSSIIGSVTSGLNSASQSLSDAISSATDDATGTETEGAATTTTDEGAARTMAPAGILAAAGLAAFLL